MDAADFAAENPGPVMVTIFDPTNEHKELNIQCEIGSTVKALTDKINAELGTKQKIQLKHGTLGFVKDQHALAHYNLTSGTRLELKVKARRR